MRPRRESWKILLLWMVLAAPANVLGADADAIVGLWSTADNDAKIEIYRCGAEYCGRISHLEEPSYPPDDKEGMAGLPKVDRHNPDPVLRQRPLIGLTFLEGFRYTGSHTWEDGRIYNPENGRMYKAVISLSGDNRVLLRGYWGVSLLGRTETWVRSGGGKHPGA